MGGSDYSADTRKSNACKAVSTASTIWTFGDLRALWDERKRQPIDVIVNIGFTPPGQGADTVEGKKLCWRPWVWLIQKDTQQQGSIFTPSSLWFPFERLDRVVFRAPCWILQTVASVAHPIYDGRLLNTLPRRSDTGS
jgi:hypothetical protein